ncbi:uncharacterized protein LOC112571027 isoform X2 [Pomacea canaliculata]|uniref:uncharacterized protein LOC112571027 isoform X2 n=1 Tax=Pomacea canaliculata TaxID=400727 RepID=UPI000D73EFD2|nr:uncharacterized protein LOC112571027 isoform X2 [Pomacea canaliculata]
MLQFILIILWACPCVPTKETGRCQGEACDVRTWHNVNCTTDDDCNQTHAACFQHLCRCEAGYFYTTPYDICSGTCSTGELQDNFTEYPDSALLRHYLASWDGLSLEDCKDRCEADKLCLTFDFRVHGGQCRLHNVTARESPSHWYPKTSEGWTHYQRSCNSTLATHHTWYNLLCNTKVDCPDPHSDCLSHRCLCGSSFKFNEAKKECVVTALSKWHNVNCTTDDDCNQPHAACYQHLCRCEAGYFYTTKDTCTSTCSTGELQDNFTEYPDSALHVYHLDRLDGLTVEDCKDRCQDDKRCLTFDFRAHGGLCRLHNVTAHESPSHWSPKTSKGWTHYQRSCNSTLASHDTWYNLLCNTKVNCPDRYSDCLSGRCLCRSGFKFNETQKKCVVTMTCRDWQDKGARSGVYTVHEIYYFDRPMTVWCDMESGGGGWLVFQRRRDFTVDFNRSWTEYVNGFGDLSGDFWLGLSTLRKVIRYEHMRLRVDIIDESGQRRYAEYMFLMWGDLSENQLRVYDYTGGDAGDVLRPSHDRVFSTYDRDPTGCVRTRHSAWWYPDDCGSTYLNSPSARGNVWGNYSNLQFSEMKLKPVDSTRLYTQRPR